MIPKQPNVNPHGNCLLIGQKVIYFIIEPIGEYVKSSLICTLKVLYFQSLDIIGLFFFPDPDINQSEIVLELQ